MDQIWSRTADQILSSGEFLGDAGVRNWALTRQEALVAIAELGSEGIAVLGGDVYKRDRAVFVAIGDGWHCDRDAEEDSETFVDRSVEAARKYVERYPGSDETYFALVPDREPEPRGAWGRDEE
jgi:hypothetical protein